MMIWTNEKPSKPGLYWYRNRRDSQVDEYESFKVFWDPKTNGWSAQTYGSGTVFLDSCSGEWYGPLAPPVNIAESDNANIHKSNTRILIRLRYGGSFYVEKILPEEIAVSLSERLKTIRRQGNSIPASIRTKITGVLHELVDFAQTPLNETQ